MEALEKLMILVQVVVLFLIMMMPRRGSKPHPDTSAFEYFVSNWFHLEIDYLMLNRVGMVGAGCSFIDAATTSPLSYYCQPRRHYPQRSMSK